MARGGLGPQRVVGGEKLRRLVAPLELVLHPPAAEGAHARALLRVVEQLGDLHREMHRVVLLRVERGFLRREAALGQVELHYRLAERHVFHDLVHGRDVVHLVGDVRVYADVRSVEHRQQLCIRHPAGEGDVVGHAELARQVLHLLQRGAAADQAEVDVGSLQLVHQVADRLQQQVDALLPAHDADVPDQIALSAFQRFNRGDYLEAFQARASAHHEHALGRHAAALDGDAAVGVVGGDRHVGEAEGQALEQAHRLPEQVAAAELGLVELRVGVVVVEHELLAEQLEQVADEEKEIRRVAGVDDVEAFAKKNFQAEEQGPGQRREVFDRIAERAFGFGRQRVAPDVDAVDRLVLLFVALTGGADDRHRIAGVAQRGRFLPHPPVERARQVLHQDENSTSHYLMAAMRTGLSMSESSETRTAEKPAANNRLRTSMAGCCVVKWYSPASTRPWRTLSMCNSESAGGRWSMKSPLHAMSIAARGSGMWMPSQSTILRLLGARTFCTRCPETSIEYTRST